MEVYDDFLPEYQFKNFDTQVLSNDYFPWYYNNGVVNPFDGKGYQFTHGVFDLHKGGTLSALFPSFKPILEKLKVRHLVRIKLNLNPRTFFIMEEDGMLITHQMIPSRIQKLLFFT